MMPPVGVIAALLINEYRTVKEKQNILLTVANWDSKQTAKVNFDR